jgi:hypothetical protein
MSPSVRTGWLDILGRIAVIVIAIPLMLGHLMASIKQRDKSDDIPNKPVPVHATTGNLLEAGSGTLEELIPPSNYGQVE